MDSARPPLRSYGRLRARALKPRQTERLERLLPRLAVPEGPFDPCTLMPEAHETWLEAGFGAGEHLAGQAERHPDVLMLGAEPFQNGVAALLGKIEAAAIGNIRLFAGDVRALLTRLPQASIGRMFVLFPDPWPKTRHRKRRLIEPGFVREAARVLRRGARLRFATDWEDYANQALAAFAACSDFVWTAERAEDWRKPPADHLTTRYEAKRLGDIAPIWMEFERR